MAHHYSRSGNTQKAVEYLGLAGQQATQRSANTEAIGHLTAALELLKTLPDTPEHIQHELTLQIALGIPIIAAKGWAAPETGKVYARSRELCQQLGETPQLLPVLWGLWGFYGMRAEHRTEHELGEQFLDLARRQQDRASLPAVHYALGGPLFQLGEFTSAWEHFKRGIALYDSWHHRSQVILYGQDPGVCCLEAIRITRI